MTVATEGTLLLDLVERELQSAIHRANHRGPQFHEAAGARKALERVLARLRQAERPVSLADLCRAWHDNSKATEGKEDFGPDGPVLDDAVASTPARTKEDVLALLDVAMTDFHVGKSDAEGDIDVDAMDPGERIWWAALNAAHRFLTATK